MLMLKGEAGQSQRHRKAMVMAVSTRPRPAIGKAARSSDSYSEVANQTTCGFIRDNQPRWLERSENYRQRAQWHQPPRTTKGRSSDMIALLHAKLNISGLLHQVLQTPRMGD